MSDGPKLPRGWSWCTDWPCRIVEASMTLANGGSVPELHAHEADRMTLSLQWRRVPTMNVMWFPETETSRDSAGRARSEESDTNG